MREDSSPLFSDRTGSCFLKRPGPRRSSAQRLEEFVLSLAGRRVVERAVGLIASCMMSISRALRPTFRSSLWIKASFCVSSSLGRLLKAFSAPALSSCFRIGESRPLEEDLRLYLRKFGRAHIRSLLRQGENKAARKTIRTIRKTLESFVFAWLELCLSYLPKELLAKILKLRRVARSL